MQNLRTIKLEFPLFDTKEDRFERVKKVHEELREVAAEASNAGVVNVEKLLLEAMDVMQTAIGLTYGGLIEIMSEEKAVAILETLLEEISLSHYDKIERYTEERGWKAL